MQICGTHKNIINFYSYFLLKSRNTTPLNVVSEPTHAETEFPFPMGTQHVVKVKVSVVRHKTLKQKLSFFNVTYFGHNTFWFHTNHFSGRRQFVSSTSDKKLAETELIRTFS